MPSPRMTEAGRVNWNRNLLNTRMSSCMEQGQGQGTRWAAWRGAWGTAAVATCTAKCTVACLKLIGKGRRLSAAVSSTWCSMCTAWSVHCLQGTMKPASAAALCSWKRARLFEDD